MEKRGCNPIGWLFSRKKVGEVSVDPKVELNNRKMFREFTKMPRPESLSPAASLPKNLMSPEELSIHFNRSNAKSESGQGLRVEGLEVPIIWKTQKNVNGGKPIRNTQLEVAMRNVAKKDPKRVQGLSHDSWMSEAREK